MAITTKEEYEQKKEMFDSAFERFKMISSDLKSIPCEKYDSNSIGIGQKCLDYIWSNTNPGGLGCDKPSTYTEANQTNKTYWQIITDAYNSVKQNPSSCYTKDNKSPPDPPSVAFMNNMYPYKGYTFVKNNNPILDMASEDMCASNCTSQNKCISATYNSESKKCWLNIGTYAEWEPPSEGSKYDVAFVNEMYSMSHELDTLNNELRDYEAKNPSYQSGGVTRYSYPARNSDDYGNGQTSMVNPNSPSDGNYNSGTQNQDWVKKILTKITSLSSDFTETKQNISSLSSDFTDIKQNIYSLSSDFTETKQNITTDRAMIAKTLEEYNKKLLELTNKQETTNATFKKQDDSNTAALVEYKKQLTDMSQKQEESNAELKNQVIAISIIAVVGILLIFIVAAVIQSMNSSNQNSFSGGGAKKCCSTVSLKQIFSKMFK